VSGADAEWDTDQSRIPSASNKYERLVCAAAAHLIVGYRTRDNHFGRREEMPIHTAKPEVVLACSVNQTLETRRRQVFDLSAHGLSVD